MGCCSSSPHARRRHIDPADLDEEIVPLRYFGAIRNGSVQVPDDIDGLSSPHISHRLASNDDTLLYTAEIDQGTAFRGCRPIYACFFTPWGLAYAVTQICNLTKFCPCDEVCCWVRKEYSTRTWLRIYSNRIEVNQPQVRVPFGFLGCGSWNADNIVTHVFDRGAFGFRPVNCLVTNYLCGVWPLYGGVVARQRCQCNGPAWNRMITDCGGWWCDEWLCDICFCSYRYYGLANPSEVAFVASICLQAYFEGRSITSEDVQKCIDYWKENISEEHGGPKREVCCEPYCKFPLPSLGFCYAHLFHPRRKIPVKNEEVTDELREVYDNYNYLAKKQILRYNNYIHPVQSSSICRRTGCRRFCGRKGCIFCFGEGCSDFTRKAGEPAPAFKYRDIDDENDASVVLRKVLGDPPPNVVYKRWEFENETSNEAVLVTRASDRAKAVDVSLL